MEEEIKKPTDVEDSGVAKEENKSEVELCQQKCDEYLNNWKRERADFINYKNEEIKRIGMLAQYTKEENVLKMLPILDSIYYAEKQMPEELQNHKWVEGFLQTKKQIDTFLQREGIEKIEVMDKPFDPNTMEAVEEVEVDPTSPQGLRGARPGTVIEEVQKGFRMDGKVLRPAKVKISK